MRWQAVPQAQPNSAFAVDKNHPDALQQELIQRLQQQVVVYDWVFRFANADDDENDPTVAWPKDRMTITAGTLVINAWQQQQGGACEDINFDPLVLPQGIEPSRDPILRARSAAYAESFRRRAKETLLDQHGQESTP